MEKSVSWEYGQDEEEEVGVQGKQTPHWEDRQSRSWRAASSFPRSSDFRYSCWMEQEKKSAFNSTKEDFKNSSIILKPHPLRLTVVIKQDWKWTLIYIIKLI